VLTIGAGVPRGPPIARLMLDLARASATLMAIVLMTDSPPTIRLIAATPMMIALKIAVVPPTVSLELCARERGTVLDGRLDCRRYGGEVRSLCGIHDDLVDQLLGHQRREVTVVARSDRSVLLLRG